MDCPVPAARKSSYLRPWLCECWRLVGFPETSGLICDPAPSPQPWHLNMVPGWVPPFALLSSVRAYGGGFSLSKASLPSCGFCSLLSTRAFQTENQTGSGPCPLMGCPGAHDLLSIFPWEPPCQPKLTRPRLSSLSLYNPALNGGTPRPKALPLPTPLPPGLLGLLHSPSTCFSTQSCPSHLPTVVHQLITLYLHCHHLAQTPSSLAPLDPTPAFSLVPAHSLTSPLSPKRHGGLHRRPNET